MMVKSSVIVTRVEPEVKKRIEQAAERKGLTVTTFVLDAVQKATEKVEKEPPVARFRGIPSWFRASCCEVKQGGYYTYANIGTNFQHHLMNLAPLEIEDDEWTIRLEELEKIIDDRDAVWNWLYMYFPKCMALIPLRRRDQFLQGFCEPIEENGIEW